MKKPELPFKAAANYFLLTTVKSTMDHKRARLVRLMERFWDKGYAAGVSAAEHAAEVKELRLKSWRKRLDENF